MLALGAVELADADPLLDAPLAKAVHAWRGDASVEVTEADLAGARQTMGDSGVAMGRGRGQWGELAS